MLELNYFKHSHSLVESENIGENTRIWAFSHVCSGAIIGNNCNICDHCYIEKSVVIGNNVTVKCGIYIWEGVIIEDDVFLGPNVVFTNDIRPRSKVYKEPAKTILKKGCSIGANTTLLAGTTIGKFAMTGIGSVVTRNILDHALVYGNPAKQHGWVDELGEKMKNNGKGSWISSSNKVYVETPSGLKIKE
jgi:acetyltransferase-like isoleucine patch superfamily enzyme